MNIEQYNFVADITIKMIVSIKSHGRYDFVPDDAVQDCAMSNGSFIDMLGNKRYFDKPVTIGERRTIRRDILNDLREAVETAGNAASSPIRPWMMWYAMARISAEKSTAFRRSASHGTNSV
jgi:hypothetical protein